MGMWEAGSCNSQPRATKDGDAHPESNVAHNHFDPDPSSRAIADSFTCARNHR